MVWPFNRASGWQNQGLQKFSSMVKRDRAIRTLVTVLRSLLEQEQSLQKKKKGFGCTFTDRASESKMKWAAVLESNWGVLKYLDFAQSLSAFFYACMGDLMSCWNIENKYLVLKHISCHIIEIDIFIYFYIYLFISIYQLIYLAKEEKLAEEKPSLKRITSYLLMFHLNFAIWHFCALLIIKPQPNRIIEALLDLVRTF